MTVMEALAYMAEQHLTVCPVMPAELQTGSGGGVAIGVLKTEARGLPSVARHEP